MIRLEPPARVSSPAPRLYIIANQQAEGGQSVLTQLANWLKRADVALPARAFADVAVQLRAKAIPTRDYLSMARAARALTAARGCRLFINERLDIAAAVGADGVHLPETGHDVATVRALAGENIAIGVSTHSPDAAARAARAGAGLIVLSPIWPTVKKRPQGDPLGPEALTRTAELMAERSDRLLALGGILGPVQAHAAIAAGARGIAGIRLFTGADVSAQDIAALWRAVAEPPGQASQATGKPASAGAENALSGHPPLHSRDELG